MPTVPIDKKTMWECVNCGECCKGIIPSEKKSLSIEVDGKLTCKNLDMESKLCKDYENRPFICQLYPLFVDFDKMRGADGVARPRIAFALENLKIHTECKGFGKGKRVYANKNLQKKLDKICYDFSIKLQKAINKEISMDEIF